MASTPKSCSVRTALPCPYCSIHLASGRVTTLVLHPSARLNNPKSVERAEYPNVSICEIDRSLAQCVHTAHPPPLRALRHARVYASECEGFGGGGRPGNDFGSFVSGFHENREQKPHLFRNRLTNKVRCGAQAHTSLPQCRAVPRFRWAPWRAVRRCGMRSWAASSW